jgi:nucleoside-diphosphate-sugar epimerase
MKLIVTGNTGLIGSEVVRAAIVDRSIDELILIGRNLSHLRHPKIKSVVHKDFLDFSGCEEFFKKSDALIWCLGISQTQVSKQQYEQITFGYTKACADFCLKVNPSIRFVFVSGDGADRSEKSKTLFKKLKGRAENYLLQCGLKDVVIARPDAVRPKRKNKKAPFLYKLAYPLFPLIEKLAPQKIIWSDVLGRALVELAKDPPEENTVENIELRVLGSYSKKKED